MLFLNSEFLSLGAPCSPKAISPIMETCFLSLFLAFAMIDIEEGGRKRKQQQQKLLNHIFRVQLEMPKCSKVVTNMHRILSLKGLIL